VDEVVHEAEDGDDEGLQVHGRPSLRLTRREEPPGVAKAPSTTSPARPETRTSGKLEQYDRYLTGGRYAQTYALYGEFRSFTLLFVTLGWERIEHIRAQTKDLPAELSGYYRFTTFDEAMANFLGPIWKSRSLSDTTVYPLVREPSAPTS
jgi:hypothetical protein